MKKKHSRDIWHRFKLHALDPLNVIFVCGIISLLLLMYLAAPWGR